MSLIQTSQQLWPNQRCSCYKTHYVFDLQFSIAPHPWSKEAQYCCWPRFGFWLSPKMEFTKFWPSPKMDFHTNQTDKFWPRTKIDLKIYQILTKSKNPIFKILTKSKNGIYKILTKSKNGIYKILSQSKYGFSYKLNLQILTKYKNRF